jgi:hypothetical protein
MAITALVSGVRLPEVNRMVYVPVGPVTARSVNVASPLAVEAVRVPPSVPLPLARLAVTTVPVVVTGLPKTSASRTVGWVASGTPLWADALGCCWTWSCAAAPAAPVALKVREAGVSPAAEAVTVLAPAAVPKTH